MTHRGPFQPLLFCDSVILPLALDLSQQLMLSAGAVMLQAPLEEAGGRRGQGLNSDLR